ncbi:molybdopterin-synthase adenylyltransferase MoeB [Candidatus Albibeggiatoa sp. nov. NOAA]|uniref:HesA/MoeB/ThiF family protein n=1 Tax=Candidatus Albibeggiatoa sp. nov. NOAA TaxID=3162724 RepID=UPI0032F48943|nr:molybdopterin-synthase adenylyltransferase MoeB [Thiotrichaceae bacterium]
MNDNQLLRYSRHILLPELDVVGQQRLLDAKIMIIGLGGLGAPASLYLAAAGVGKLVLCDFDKVELSNLQRQITHHTENIGQYKVDSALQQLKANNPDCQIETCYQAFDPDTLSQQLSDIDVVLDCTDNLQTRLQINQACVNTQTPLVSAAAIRMEGQISVFLNQSTQDPCYRCLYQTEQDLQETCTQTGVLAPLVGVIGSMQALETIKLIAKIGKILHGRLLILDVLHMEWYTMQLRKNPNCPVCRSGL